MFLLIWKGWGIVVFAIAVVWIAIGIGLAGAINADKAMADALTGLSLVPAGVMTWFAGKRMNRNTTRTLVDPQTGNPVVIRREHSLFFVKVEWWGPILIVLGILVFVVELVPTTR